MITNLKRGDIVDEKYLNQCDTSEVRAVLAECAEQRSVNRSFNRGFSKDKEMRKLGDIPTLIYNHPMFRHIFHNDDPDEGERNRRAFLRTHNKFLCVDKI